MSFRLSIGTLDTMAGIFAPSDQPVAAGGGRTGRQRKPGALVLAVVAHTISPKAAPGTGVYRAGRRTKQAFGGGSQAAASGRAISAMDRTARRVPEVMVRITGRQHGGGHVLANFAYISRLGRGQEGVALYTSDGEVIRDAGEMQELAQDWAEWEMGDETRRKGATSLSMILSMPSGTEPELVKAAALDFAREEFANRSWVASLHVDRDHPHVHITFARRDLDGRRFHPDRDDLFRFRQRFAQKLRDRGIEANATPAKARGVDAKHEHIAVRKVRGKGGTPRIDQSRLRRRDRAHRDDRPDAVAQHLAQRKAIARGAYMRSIAELRATPTVVNRIVADGLQRFVDEMTEPEPNWRRTISRAEHDRASSSRTVAARIDSGAPPDPVTAAIARSIAMKERIDARRAEERARDEGTRATADRQRASEPTSDRPIEGPPSRDPVPPAVSFDKTLSDALRRNEAKRERDRAPDKGGPKR